MEGLRTRSPTLAQHGKPLAGAQGSGQSDRMMMPSDLWPPAGLVVRSGDLVLTPVIDDDLPGLAELTLAGIHEPGAMPFSVPWTLAPADQLPRQLAAYHWGVRAAFRPDDFHLELAVRRQGELVGTQGFGAKDYLVTRTAETGSWLGRRHQGQGIGTRMRRAVCTLLVDHLDAAELTSGAWLDNAPSLAVSRKVGYREGDVTRMVRLGVVALHRRLVLRPDDLVRGEPVQVTGAEPLRAFLGLTGKGRGAAGLG